MKISIITPSFNQGEYIEETIDSILSQGYADLDYIIIDGGSTDNSVEIIKKYEKYLNYWISEKDRGQSHAINKGLVRATGAVINWINSDDYLESGALTAIAEAFKNPETNVFIGKSNIVKNGEIIRQSRGTDVYPGNLAKTLGLARIDQPEHWWRRSVIDKIGPLNENLHYIMDRDWWVKYLLSYGLEGIEKTTTVLTNFRLHEASKTVSLPKNFFEERNNYFNSLAKHYGYDKLLILPHEPKLLELNNKSGAINLTLFHEAMQHFQLLLADETYISKEYKVSKKILQNVEKDKFSHSEKAFLRKLKIRSNIPSALIRLSQKFR